MRLERSEKVMLIIAVLSFLIGIFVYDKMPPSMAAHWNLHGEVDGYLPRFWGVFILPLLLTGLAALYILIPRVGPLKENIRAFITYHHLFAIFSLVFLFGIYIQILLWNVGTEISFFVTLPLGLGLLFFFLEFFARMQGEIGLLGYELLGLFKVLQSGEKLTSLAENY